ncbi:hypothetical protein K435DRAFT_767273 [Dendrothele bispora CBS 962.96]|uniref:Uncharacterized protein n=1 Tax=Dendrothele bispora (strain CBS 962.96) TaxID=1314807 RepID=A0A4S8KZQ5_DENBC|nr:hypothetical protein K435DRAFT_767273 [Dendrothele bispora CBS 962.96]
MSPQARQARQVRNTVLSIIKDLVPRGSETTGGRDPTDIRSILESCSEACASYSLSLSQLLQEKSIAAHTPLYWAIVNRTPDDRRDEEAGGPDLLTCLLSFTAPLRPSTVSEVHLACLHTLDQELFRRLKMSPDFAPLSGTDQMLLGATTIPDDVVVENSNRDNVAFTANLTITQFQKRMRVSKRIEVEFIARGRMWRLAFKVSQKNHDYNAPPPGTWCVSLSLMENSPPTVLDSKLIIPQVLSSGSLSIPMSTSKQLVPLEMFDDYNNVKEILIPLTGNGVAGTLEHAGSLYIGPDDSLKARFEARLAKPG